MKNITILGSTGSIGSNTLEVIRQHPDKFNVIGLAAGKNIDLLTQQIERFHPQIVCIGTEKLAQAVKSKFPSNQVKVLYGEEGLIEIATWPNADMVVSATAGSTGLLATYAAVKEAKQIAFANKETLVMAGEIIMAEVKKQKNKLIPIDSEHSALFQTLQGRDQKEIRRIILTASGGPFLNLPLEKMASVSVQEALNHPNWKMGRKISIDSATLMNKGLEVIEAYWLFNLKIEEIDVIIHPQSIVHSIVEFIDGSLLAHMGITDMKIPIQYALTYPDRFPSPSEYINFTDLAHLEFMPPDKKKFPCLELCLHALRQGKSMPIVLNAANEIAVDIFLQGIISLDKIALIIEKTLENHTCTEADSIEKIQHIDKWARKEAKKIAQTLI